MNMTNKMLAAFLALAIVVSVAGTIISLNRIGRLGQTPTGAATLGIVDVTVTANAEVVALTNVSFGSAAILEDTVVTTMTANPGTFFDCDDDRVNATTCGGLAIKNIGNVNVNVSMVSDKNAATFLGGTGPRLDYKLTNGNTSNASAFVNGGLPGCRAFGNGCNQSNTTWNTGGNECALSTTPVVICNNLTYTDTNDTMRVELNLTIPLDGVKGAQTATITFAFTQN